MSHQNTFQPVEPLRSPAMRMPRRSDDTRVPGWVAAGLLAVAGLVLLALAGSSAWLSYHAQVAYVLMHNGGRTAEARVWALLLDSGTVGVSLLRLHETVRGRPALATRASLLGCITASVTMNLLHTPSRTPGGYLVAAVPPVMYAVFLEHLLANLRSLLIAGEHRSGRPPRSLTLWVNFPALMWNARRGALRLEAQDGSMVPGSDAGGPAALHEDAAVGEAEHIDTTAQGRPDQDAADLRRPRGRGPGAKRIAFEAALVQQVQRGDLRLFSGDERERNAAAYRAAASLDAPLSRGAARRYVVQALPRLECYRGCGDVAAREAG